MTGATLRESHNSYNLINFVMEHPEEAKGISFTLDGRELAVMMKMIMGWMKEEYDRVQRPQTMTTKQACEHFHVSDRYLRLLAKEGLLEKSFNGRCNIYYVEQLHAVLAKKRHFDGNYGRPRKDRE